MLIVEQLRDLSKCHPMPGILEKAAATIVHLKEQKEIMSKLARDVLEFVYLLEIEETTDEDGRPFHPNRISSCRAMDGAKMNELLTRMKQMAESELTQWQD